MPMLERLKVKRSDVPAITHLDYSARLQTVSKRDKPDYHEVISEFEKLTGYAVIVNTSFNVRGEPIICTPEDAYRCFMRTEMDVLIIDNFILRFANRVRRLLPEWEVHVFGQNGWDTGGPCPDLYDLYAGHNPGKLTVHAYDAHPNEFAHALASPAIAEFIEEEAIK
jgi:hypothetical protein